MRITLLLAATSVVIHSDITDIETGTKSFISARRDLHNTEASSLTEFQRTKSSPGVIGVSARGRLPTNELKHSREQGKEINQGLKGFTTKLRNYDRNVNKPVSKPNSGRVTWQAPFQSDTTIPERNEDQIFDDMEDGARRKRQVMKDNIGLNSTWKNGVFYTFNTSDPILRKLFKMGVKVWSDATCIDFIEDRNAHDKVVVVKESGSFSNIGRRGGDQLLSLGEDGPTVGSVVHEIGHVLGFFHTMERYDRDRYIIVFYQNIDPHHIEEFGKKGLVYADVYGLTYDYGSVMHFAELSCSINNDPTLYALDRLHQKTMGSELISFSDILMINERYGCNERCNKSTSAMCENGGYPHPRNCSICICPSGYGGALCDRRPPGCGEDLVATSKTKSVAYKLGFGTDLRDQFDFCNYMITAPEGKKIEVNVQSISMGYDEGGCPSGGVEIKAQKDQKLTGYRFCSKNGSEGPILSNSNRLPVILFNRLGIMQTTFTYRYVD